MCTTRHSTYKNSSEQQPDIFSQSSEKSCNRWFSRPTSNFLLHPKMQMNRSLERPVHGKFSSFYCRCLRLLLWMRASGRWKDSMLVVASRDLSVIILLTSIQIYKGCCGTVAFLMNHTFLTLFERRALLLLFRPIFALLVNRMIQSCPPPRPVGDWSRGRGHLSVPRARVTSSRARRRCSQGGGGLVSTDARAAAVWESGYTRLCNQQGSCSRCN